MSNVQVKGISQVRLKYKKRSSNIGVSAFKWLDRDVKPSIISVIESRFQGETDGTRPWAPLSLRTMRERVIQGYPPSHPILRRTGDLKSEAVSNWKNNLGIGETKLSFTIKSRKAWAHQTGKGREGQVLPKRSFMTLTTYDKMQIRRSYSAFLRIFNQTGDYNG